MKHLNNVKLKKGAILLLIVSILFFSSFIGEKGDDLPIINKETVRKDVLQNYKGDIYDGLDFVNRDTSTFYAQYSDTYCFIHIPYSTQPCLKWSLLAVYYLKDKSWKYQTTIPYYDGIELLDQKNLIFWTGNGEYCRGSGFCDYYCEVSKFTDNDMVPLVKYDGYFKDVYYDFLLFKGEKSSVLEDIGDTITNVVSLSDFTFDANGLKSYKLVRKIGILNDIKKDSYDYDSLVIKQSKIEELINSDFLK